MLDHPYTRLRAGLVAPARAAAGRAGGLPAGSRRPFRARRRPPAPAAPAALSRPRTQVSGSATTGPGSRRLLDPIWAGDTVVVVALDRLGRSLSRAIPTVETLTEAGVLLRSLREGIEHSTATGRMLAGMFAALRDC